ncbi:hypothetical protein PMAYCL1PPCAC_12917, partial [Pristionchus mayeri]
VRDPVEFIVAHEWMTLRTITIVDKPQNTAHESHHSVDVEDQRPADFLSDNRSQRFSAALSGIVMRGESST